MPTLPLGRTGCWYTVAGVDVSQIKATVKPNGLLEVVIPKSTQTNVMISLDHAQPSACMA